MSDIGQLLENNKQWAERTVAADERFFARLAEQQSPKYLWIGCSDSRVSANVIVDLAPGEVFVHRNVANLVNHTDMNCLSVIQFAVEGLEVEHIIVCGHYGCGGIAAAMDGKRHGLIDNWLRHIRDTANLHAADLNAIENEEVRLEKLCRLNVAEQVINVAETTTVQDAWERGRQIAVHGWIYGLKDGLIRDLDISVSDESGMENLRDRFLTDDKRRRTGIASN
ncbi:MAG TPA: carbonate dehydratase [Pyrinomonadaceae bacterium]|jgi:carbonic anhydrase|nr:carbonate dehydratase [Pyrinomonadaceae bacterium]